MDTEQIIDLIMFLTKKEYAPEYRIEDNDITIWLNFDEIKEFTKIVGGYERLCEGSYEVTLMYECIVFKLSDFIDKEELKLIIKKLRMR